MGRPSSAGLVSGVRSLSTGQTILIGFLLLFLVLTLTMPLRTYAQQRADLAETRDNIARMEARIAQLEKEKELYSNPAYIREQARLRLGLIKPGETPFRILDPTLGQQHENSGQQVQRKNDKAWYAALWDSISVPPQPETTVSNPGREQATKPESLPTVPDPEAPQEGQQ